MRGSGGGVVVVPEFASPMVVPSLRLTAVAPLGRVDGPNLNDSDDWIGFGGEVEYATGSRSVGVVRREVDCCGLGPRRCE